MSKSLAERLNGQLQDERNRCQGGLKPRDLGSRHDGSLDKIQKKTCNSTWTSIPMTPDFEWTSVLSLRNT